MCSGVTLNYSTVSKALACAEGTSDAFSFDEIITPTLQIGTVLYSGLICAIPAPDGYYQDPNNSNVIFVVNGFTPGEITSVEYCSGLTYYLQPCCGGETWQVTTDTSISLTLGEVIYFNLFNPGGPNPNSGCYSVVPEPGSYSTYTWNYPLDSYTSYGVGDNCVACQISEGEVCDTPTPTPTQTQTQTPTTTPTTTPTPTHTPFYNYYLTGCCTENSVRIFSGVNLGLLIGEFRYLVFDNNTNANCWEVVSAQPVDLDYTWNSVDDFVNPTLYGDCNDCNIDNEIPCTTPTPTPTPTPTNPPTPTPTPTATEPYDIYLFEDCCFGNYYRYENVPGTLTVGQVFNIQGGSGYNGCAQVIPYAPLGTIYPSLGVVFTLQVDCGTCLLSVPCATPTPTVTPTPTQTPSNTPTQTQTPSNTPTNTQTPTVTPTNTTTPSNTPTQTVTPSTSPSWPTECGGPCLEIKLENTSTVATIEVSYRDCLDNDSIIILSPLQIAYVCYCDGSLIVPSGVIATLTGAECGVPEPSQTPNPTPTNTPTVSSTPSACPYTEFCFRTNYSSLSDYNGNYEVAGTYNSRLYYTGDGVTTGYIYHTGDVWCLSDSLGGTCLLEGTYPCYSICPDISSNYFSSGPCPTPTPSAINCNTLDFTAYFDCDFVPFPTPTPSITCENVTFNVTSVPTTPTPTPSPSTCNGDMDFSFSAYTPTTPSPTLTPTISPTRTVEVGGQLTYKFFEESFVCPFSQVLKVCDTGVEYYVSDSLTYDGLPLTIGTTFGAYVNGELYCLTYDRNDSNISPNSIVEAIVQVYGNCTDCRFTLTPTPSVTTSVTPTPTITPTHTMTPTPSPQSFVYVYQTCAVNQSNYPQSTVVQTQPTNFSILSGQTFQDNNGNCWTYVGQFTNFYPGEQTILVNYNGNYFNLNKPTIYSDCTSCEVNNVVLVTPTPTYIPLCITTSESNYRSSLPDECGTYTRQEKQLTVTLRYNGIPYPAPSNVTVTFQLEKSRCGTLTNENLVITIPQGQTSGSNTYTSSTCVQCQVNTTGFLGTVNYNLTQTKTVNGIISITPSTITECN